MKPATLMPAVLLLASPVHAGALENKQLVASFIKHVFVERNADAARAYLGRDYRQHNPHVAPGPEGFVTSTRAWFSRLPAGTTDETLHLVAEGDLVVAHQRLTYTARDGTKQQVTGFDLYRVRNGRIVEHWDSDQ